MSTTNRIMNNLPIVNSSMGINLSNSDTHKIEKHLRLIDFIIEKKTTGAVNHESIISLRNRPTL